MGNKICAGHATFVYYSEYFSTHLIMPFNMFCHAAGSLSCCAIICRASSSSNRDPKLELLQAFVVAVLSFCLSIVFSILVEPSIHLCAQRDDPINPYRVPLSTPCSPAPDRVATCKRGRPKCDRRSGPDACSLGPG